MAAKIKNVSAKNSTTSTKWLTNALKSIGVSANNVLKNDFAPNIYDAASSGVKTSRTLVSTIRKNITSMNAVQKQISNNKYIKFARDAYKNALQDLKNGNFNNIQRSEESWFSDGDNGFNLDDDFSFGDDGGNDIDINVMDGNGETNEALFAVSTQLQKNQETTLRTNQANMDAMIAMNTASLMQVQQIGSDILGSINTINENLGAIIEFNNTNMTRFVQSSIAFYERMGAKFDVDSDPSYKKEKLNATSVFNNANGGINISAYKDYIKQNVKDLSDSGMVGLAKTLLDDDMLKMAASNPIGFLTEGVIKWAVPKALTTGIKGAEQAFSSFMPALLHKFSEWGDSYASGVDGNIKKIFGQVFGIKIERTKNFNKGTAIEKGPVPFDGITRHAITEIITKELRDQTAYLKAIADHYKIDTKSAEKNARVFDYNNGKYTTEKEVTDNIVKNVRTTTVGTMRSGKFGKELSKVKQAGRTPEEQAIIDGVLEEVFYRLEMNSGQPFELTEDKLNDKNSNYSQMMKKVNGGKGVKQLITERLRDMIKNNPDAILDLRRSMLSASNDRNKEIKRIQENASDYGLFAATDFDKKSVDEMILESFKSNNDAKMRIHTPSKRGSNNKRKNSADKQRELVERMNSEFSSEEIKNRLAASRNYKDYDEEDESGGGFSFLNRKKQESSLGKAFSNLGKTTSSAMLGILHGNSDEAINNLITSIGDTAKELFNRVEEDFLNPLKESLFGSKDNDGFSRNGVFSGVKNGIADTFNMIKYNITGQGYKTSDGSVFEDKKEGTVLSNLRKIGTEIKNGVLEKVLGKKDNKKEKVNHEKDDNEKDDNGKDKGAFGGFKEVIQKGLAGWSEAFFGKELTDDEKSKLGETMKKEISDRLPNTLTGSAIGAGLGMMSGSSLLGWMVGGPIGGIAIGTAVGFASKSEKFQNWLFGEKDEKGDRTGGFISKNVQDFFKEHKGALIGGTAIGAAKGMLFGAGAGKLGGLLGTLVGGPIGGALMGLASSIVIKSKTFHEFLFGDEDTGQRGIFEHFQSLFKNSGGEEQDSLNDGGKLLGMSFLGAGAGAGAGMITMGVLQKMGIIGASLTPAGPIGGAIAGLAASIFAQRKNFSTILFGKKDKDGNKIEEGILGQFKNMIKVSVLKPLKDSMDNFIDDAKFTLTYKILDPIRFAVEPVGKLLKEVGTDIKDSVKATLNNVSEGIKKAVLDPINDLLLKPIMAAVNGVSKAIWGTTKSIITFPFTVLKTITGIITNPIVEAVDSAKKFVKKNILKPIANKVKKIMSGLFKGIGKVTGTILNLVAAPIKGIGGVATYLSDKVYHIGGKEREKKKVGKKLEGKAEWSERLKQMRIDSANKIKNREERRIRTKNEQIIAKATNYQRTEDTEENRKLARDLGFKINDRIDAVKDKKDIGSTKGMTEAEISGANFKELNEDAKHTNLLLSIRDNFVDFAKFLKKKFSGNKQDFDDENNEESYRNTNNDEKSNSENKKEKDKDKKANRDDSEEEYELTDIEKIAKNIHDAGGIGKYIKNTAANKFTNLKNDVKKGYDNSFAQNLVNDTKLVPDKIKNIISKFKGNGFAKGTENAPKNEAVMVGEEGPELMLSHGGEQIFANSKPLQVYVVGAVGSVLSSIGGKVKGAFNNIKNAFTSKKNDDNETVSANEEGVKPEADMTDAVDNSNAIIDLSSKSSNAVNVASNAVNMAESIMGESNDEKEQEEKEDAQSTIINHAIAAEDQKKAVDKAITAEERQAQIKEEEDRARLDAIKTNTAEQVKEQKGFTDLWSSIFSKKGLITAGILIAAPILLSVLKKLLNLKLPSNLGELFGITGSTVSNAVESEKTILENGGLGDGKNIQESTEETLSRTSDGIFALKPILKLIGIDVPDVENNDGEGTMGIRNEDNRWDRESLPLFKLNAKNGAKGIATGYGAIIKALTRGKMLKDYGKAAKEFLKTGSISSTTKEALQNSKAAVKELKGKSARKVGSDKLIENGMNKLKEQYKRLSKKTGEEAVEAVEKNASKSGTKVVEKTVKEVGESTIDDVAKGAKGLVKNGGSNAVKNIEKTALKGNSDDILKVITEKIGKFLDSFAAKVGSKAGKSVGKGTLKTVGKKVIKWCTEHLNVIIKPITEILTATAALASTVIGLAAKEATWVVLGAIDGATGTAKLFKVDQQYVDPTMIIISTALGAFNGTTIGCIIDVINSAIASATGFDLYTEAATLLYNLLSGEEKADILRAGREEFEDKYATYQDEELGKQYEIMKEQGYLLDSSMTKEEYIDAVKNGDEVGAYMSFQEYNVDQHKSVGDAVFDPVSKGFNSIIGYGKVGTKTDSEGNVYTINGDGTVQVTDSEGNDKGVVSEDIIDRVDIVSEDTRYEGALENFGESLGKGSYEAGKGIGNFFINAGKGISNGWKWVFGGDKGTAFIAPDGSYYDTDGNHYNVYGQLLEEAKFSIDELSDMVSRGELVIQDDFQIEQSGLIGGIRQGWDTFTSSVASGWNSFTTGVSQFGENLKNKASETWNAAVKGVSDFWTVDRGTAFVDVTDGTYYLPDGTHMSANHEPLGDTVTEEELNMLIATGQVEQDDDFKLRESGFNKLKGQVGEAIASIPGKLSDAYNACVKGVTTLGNEISKKAGETWNAVTSWVSNKAEQVGNFFSGHEGTAWFDHSEGIFYMKNGDTYEKYSTNGTLLESGIPEDKVQTLIKSGVLTEGEASVAAGIVSTAKNMGTAISNAWTGMKDGLVKGWNSFCKGVTTIGDEISKKAGETWNAATTWISNKGTNLKNAFFDRSDEAWQDVDGGFYMLNGDKYEYYNANGELLQEGIDYETIEPMIKSGALVKCTKTVSGTLLQKGKQLINNVGSALVNVGSAISSGWNNFCEGASNLANNFASGVSSAFSGAVNWIQNKGEQVMNFFLDHTEQGWQDATGGYYVANGDSFSYYNADGELIIEKVDNPEEVSANIANGVYKSISVEEQAGIKAKLVEIKNGLKNVRDKLGDMFNKAKDTAISAFNSAKDAVGGFFESVKEDGVIGAVTGLFKDKTTVVWYDSQGNYYELNKDKKTYNYCNANGDVITEKVSKDEVKEKISAGLLTKGKKIKDSAAKAAINKIKDAVKNAWESAKNTVVNGWNTFTSWLTGGSGDGNNHSIADFSSDEYGERSLAEGSESANNLKGIGKTKNKKNNKKNNNKTGGSGNTSLKYYSQNNSKWAKLPYGDDGATMGDTGCGPTSMAMVASTLTNKDVRPDELASFAEFTGMRDETGTNSRFIDLSAHAYGLNSTEVLLPNADSLISSAKNGPTILLGQKVRGVKTPYTNEGHYVVTDGVDSHGNIRIKDPRGASYNTKFTANELAASTSSLWGFRGGKGKGANNSSSSTSSNKTDDKNKNNNNTTSSNKTNSTTNQSTREAWLTIVKEVKRQYVENPGGGHYSQTEYIDVTINGKTNHCRLDCSGYVSSCLNFFGVTDKINMGIYQNDHICMKDTGFTYYHFPGSWDQVGIGDIMANTEHTQIFAGMIDGQPYVWSIGSDSQVKTPDPTPMGSQNYDEFWSPDGAHGTGCSVGGTTLSGTSADGSSSGGTVFDTITNFFSEFSSKAVNGLLTGNFDTNYTFGNTDTTSGTSSSTSSVTGSVGTGVLSGSSNAEKIYNYLVTSGLTPAAAAGIMGNFERESGLLSNNLQNDYEGSLGYSDESYTKAVDDGSYTNFGNDSAGYGLAQWTYSTRKQNLLNFAKSKGKSIGDLGMQLDFLMKEISENYSGLIEKLNAASTPEEAAQTFEKIFENAGVVAMGARTSAARKYYDMYKDKTPSSTTGGKGAGSLPTISKYDPLQHGSKTQQASSIRNVNFSLPKTKYKYGGKGDFSITSDDVLSSFNYDKNYTMGVQAQKYISDNDSNNLSTAINYIIGYLDAITNNTAGTNDKLGALSELKNIKPNNNVVISGNGNTNISAINGNTKTQKQTNIKKNTSISRNMQLAEKLSKGI